MCARSGSLLLSLLLTVASASGCQRGASEGPGRADPAASSSGASGQPAPSGPGTAPSGSTPVASGSAPVASGSAPVASGSGSAAPVASAPGAEPPPPLDEVTALIAWFKDDKAPGGVRSQWIERVNGKASVSGERRGLVAVSSASLWTIETTVIKGCPQQRRGQDGDVVSIPGLPDRVRPDMDMPVLVRSSDKLRLAPWQDGHGYPIRGTQCPDSLLEYGASISMAGGMGPFVVVSLRSYENHGGAHGVRGESFFTLDLDRGAPVKLAPPASDLAALIRSAASRGGQPTTEGDAVTEKNLAAVLPMYGPSGEGLAIYRFSLPDSYAGSAGGNSYTVDIDLSSRSLPASLAPYRRLPAWVAPKVGHAVSLFMIAPGRVAEARRQFDAAYPAVPRPAASRP